MFTLSRDEITFEVVEKFCKEWSEGVRVEYKQEVVHIPKIVSSFANTLGGIFIIGVEADKETNKVVSCIKGIPKVSGIEEQIQQSTSEGIHPSVMPDIKILDVPNSNNVVVVVRVDESVQAPHAIQNSTKIYVRVGSTTPPYEFAEVDRIAYMLKRREDSQVVAGQIIDRIEERTQVLYATEVPNLTVIAKPVYPYRPVISTSDIYELDKGYAWHPRRVAGGISYLHKKKEGSIYREFNEYGIAYYRTELIVDEVEQGIEYGQILLPIKFLIKDAEKLYTKCEYLGNIEVTAQLRQVFEEKLYDAKRTVSGRSENITDGVLPEPECFDSTVSASKQCLLRDFQDPEKLTDIVEELVLPLLWAFNIPTDDSWKREQIRTRIKYA